VWCAGLTGCACTRRCCTRRCTRRCCTWRCTWRCCARRSCGAARCSGRGGARAAMLAWRCVRPRVWRRVRPRVAAAGVLLEPRLRGGQGGAAARACAPLRRARAGPGGGPWLHESKCTARAGAHEHKATGGRQEGGEASKWEHASHHDNQ